MTTIYQASVTDAALLIKLSRDIYAEHYLHLWHPGGAKWYMEEYAYAADKIEQELKDPRMYWFIIAEDAVPAGYMKLVLSSPLEGYSSSETLEVERIYLHTHAAGKQYGTRLMEVAMQEAVKLEKKAIFLKAMDSSTRAIAFYEKLGYIICGSLQLPMPAFSLMKEEYRGMVILKQETGL